MFDAQIVIFEVNIQIRQNQPLADEVPDNAGHFIPVHFHNRVFDLDFSHDYQSISDMVFLLFSQMLRNMYERHALYGLNSLPQP